MSSMNMKKRVRRWMPPGCHPTDPGFPLKGYGEELNDVFSNIWDNAFSGIWEIRNQEGAVRVTMDRRGGELHIVLWDNGPGLMKDEIARALEPGFEPRGSREWVDLSQSAAIVERHGGRLKVRNRISRGLEFRIILPMISQSVVH